MEKISCSPTISELSCHRDSNGVVIVNSGQQSHPCDSDHDSDFNCGEFVSLCCISQQLVTSGHDEMSAFDSGFSYESSLRKASSLPIIDNLPRPDHKNSASSSTTNLPDDMNKVSEFALPPRGHGSFSHSDDPFESSSKIRSSESPLGLKPDPVWLESSPNNPEKFMPDARHEFGFDDLDDEYLALPNDSFTMDQGSEYFLPMYGLYPRAVSSTSYTELLDGIEFDKLKERLVLVQCASLFAIGEEKLRW